MKKWISVIGFVVLLGALAAIWSPGKEKQEQTEQAAQENKPVAEQIDSVKEHVEEKEVKSKETTSEETSEAAATKPVEETAPQVTEIPAEANELLKEAEKSGTASEQTPAPKAETGSTSADVETGGLYFASQEEAMQFVFSRFSQQEIALYNKVSANGLTAEQQQMALQIAYSRFSAEEIAAIEAALK
ncbi:hypothetical protein M3221_23005 [Domibacillus indicus]|uniref:hypothetical protein n=1 Tax=Domibacillus indicus TaxID=1437523 RepID=UPI00203DDBA6|nr:hypothetical protein [Domibacillus indicus]MCM3791206.1 hypothetical protein [Domibacillus indicus]